MTEGAQAASAAAARAMPWAALGPPMVTLHGGFCNDANEPRRWLWLINSALESAAEKPQLSKFGAAQPESL